MPYISTDLNRTYSALESAYGVPPAISGADAFRALRVNLELVQEYLERRDKSGSRTFPGVIAGGRRHARFEVDAYLTPSGSAGAPPDMAPFFQAACGALPLTFAGGQAAAGCTTTSIVFGAPHGLAVGQAIVSGDELRFVTSVDSPTQVTVNPPFSAAPPAASNITATVNYPLGASLPSLAIFDYWDPAGAQQRYLSGGVVERMEVQVNGDFHQVRFAGRGADVVIPAPAEPASPAYTGSPLAGHLGQIWLGNPASKFSTLARAELQLDNGVELRGNEFGSAVALGSVAGLRRVGLDFEVFEMDDAQTQALYTAARNRTPIVAALQLGAATGSLFGAYLKGLTPQVPRYDQSERQLRWNFTGSRASGGVNDELWLAFG
jgi:hypothetical protein